MTAPHDLNALLVFAAVVETGGFTAAADRLGVAKAKVSVEIGRLERQLGLSLFSRTTRRVVPTDAGQALYDEAVPLVRGAQDVMAQLGGGGRLEGLLRIGATVDHAVQSLALAVAEFAQRHPGLQIELRSSDRVVDLVKEGIDLAIRIGWLRDSSLHATQLGRFEQYIAASPAYLARAGRPRVPQDLAAHDWVALTLLQAPLTWKFTPARGAAETVRMKSRLRADSAAALRALLQSGAGISALDQFSFEQAGRDGQLERVLPDWRLPEGGIYAVYPPGRHVQAKVRAFIDFYADYLKRAS